MPKPKILYLDDEKANLTSFKYLFKTNFDIFIAETAEQGYEILRENDIPVVISDQRMPGTTGTQFFETIYHDNPEQIRILLTGYSDIDAIIDAVNKGHIYRYIKKPYDQNEINIEINKAIEFYSLKKENKDLVEKISESNIQLQNSSKMLEKQLSEKKKNEEKILEQASLIDKAQDAIMVINPEDYITYWNESASRLYGWSAKEVMGKKYYEIPFNPEIEKIDYAIDNVFKYNEWHGELNQVSSHNDTFIVESRWSLIRDSENIPHSILIINTDITERKKLEKQVFHSQRMESIAILAGGISHEINNIFTPILLCVKYIRKNLQDEKSIKLLEVIKSSVERGSAIVKQVLLLARTEESKFEKIEITKLIDEIKKTVSQTFPRNINFKVNIQDKLWTVKGNMVLLHQVLLNILLNACDAMENGGKLRIDAKNIIMDNSKIANINAGRFIEIIISDTGSGIPENILDKIFDPFFTTKEVGKGTGLGLSTSLSIIKNHGGIINVSSVPGKGTSFKIYLPVTEITEVTDNRETKANKKIARGKEQYILVVDDEIIIQEIIRDILTNYGYHVFTAANGQEALTIFLNNQDKIKLIIMDINTLLPDGKKVYETIQEINNNIPIIISSGAYNNDKRIEQKPNLYLLSKPYSEENLLEMIAKCIIKK